MEEQKTTVITKVQTNLESMLKSIMGNIQEQMFNVNKSAFIVAHAVYQINEKVTAFREITPKDTPIAYNGSFYRTVEDFAKTELGLSKSAYHAKVKLAREFCNADGTPNEQKTMGLTFSALQDLTAAEVKQLETTYKSAEPESGSTKKPFADLTAKEIRQLKQIGKLETKDTKLLSGDSGNKPTKKLPIDRICEIMDKMSDNITERNNVIITLINKYASKEIISALLKANE